MTLYGWLARICQGKGCVRVSPGPDVDHMGKREKTNLDLKKFPIQEGCLNYMCGLSVF